jgi:hypothetical protein
MSIIGSLNPHNPLQRIYPGDKEIHIFQLKINLYIMGDSIYRFQMQSKVVYPWLSVYGGFLYDIPGGIPAYHPAQSPPVIDRENDHNARNGPEISPCNTGQTGILDGEKEHIQDISADNWGIYRRNHHRTLLNMVL